MNRKSWGMGVPLLIFIVSIIVSVALTPLVYPEVKPDPRAGIDQVEATTRDILKDDDRRTFVVFSIFVGAGISIFTGYRMWRKGSTSAQGA